MVNLKKWGAFGGAATLAVALIAGCSDEETNVGGGEFCESPLVERDLLPGFVGEPYQTGWRRSGGFQVDAPPPGLNALLEGTPTEKGVFEVTVRFGEQESCQEEKTYSLEIGGELPVLCASTTDCRVISAPFVRSTCERDNDCESNQQCVSLGGEYNFCAETSTSGNLICGQCLRIMEVKTVGSTFPRDMCVFDENDSTCPVDVYQCTARGTCCAGPGDCIGFAD